MLLSCEPLSWVSKHTGAHEPTGIRPLKGLLGTLGGYSPKLPSLGSPGDTDYEPCALQVLVIRHDGNCWRGRHLGNQFSSSFLITQCEIRCPTHLDIWSLAGGRAEEDERQTLELLESASLKDH